MLPAGTGSVRPLKWSNNAQGEVDIWHVWEPRAHSSYFLLGRTNVPKNSPLQCVTDLVLLLLILDIRAENLKGAKDKIGSDINLIDNRILKKSPQHAYKKEGSSLASQSTDFINTYSESANSKDDLAVAEDQHAGYSYVQDPSQTSCNSCGAEPWIPISTSNGYKTTIYMNRPSQYTSNLNKDSFKIATSFPQNFLNTESPFQKQNQLYRPPSDLYGAPQPLYGPPRKGDIVDFMLPPPVKFTLPRVSYGSLNNPNGFHQSKYGPPFSQLGPLDSSRPSPHKVKPSFNINGVATKNNSPHLYHKNNNPAFGYGSTLASKPPITNYGIPFENIGSPPEFYGPQKYSLNSPKPNYDPIIFTHERPPDRHHGDADLGQSFPNSDLRGHNFRYTVQDSYIENVLPIDESNVLEESLPGAIPSDSYGAPVTQDYLEHLASLEPVHSNSNFLTSHLPYPNANSVKVPHVYNNANFNKHIPPDQTTAVQIVPSIKLADYVSSIEHPVNIIQSPILEVNVKGNLDNFQEQISNQEYNHFNINKQILLNNEEGNNLPRLSSVESSHPAPEKHNQKEGNVNTKTLYPLKNNPIVVEDTHTSASNINSTYTSLNELQTTHYKSKEIRFKENKPVLNFKVSELPDNHIRKLKLRHGFIRGAAVQNINTDNVSNSKLGTPATKLDKETHLAHPAIKYSNWTSSDTKTASPLHIISISSSMVPPPPSHSTWLSPSTSNLPNVSSNPKQIQIIVPYVTKLSKPNPTRFDKIQLNGAYTTLLPVFSPPPLSAAVDTTWRNFNQYLNTSEHKPVPARKMVQSSTTAIFNLRELLANEHRTSHSTTQLPYDFISLQKNIDSWTQQEFSNKLNFGDKLTTKLAIAKKIPNEYFTTEPYIETTSISPNEVLSDYLLSSSETKESLEKTFESNLIIPAETRTEVSTFKGSTTLKSTKLKHKKSVWDLSHITVSNATREKIYIVTPKTYSFFTSTPATAWSMPPKIENGKSNNGTQITQMFSVRVEPEGNKTKEALKKEIGSAIKLIYSEWPHIINDLQTTTTPKPTSRHPLFGLMDISAYTPPPNSTVGTILGHSKVISVVTPAAATQKKTTRFDENNTTNRTTPTSS